MCYKLLSIDRRYHILVLTVDSLMTQIPPSQSHTLIVDRSSIFQLKYGCGMRLGKTGWKKKKLSIHKIRTRNKKLKFKHCIYLSIHSRFLTGTHVSFIHVKSGQTNGGSNLNRKVSYILRRIDGFVRRTDNCYGVVRGTSSHQGPFNNKSTVQWSQCKRASF